jgi:hypothetical protein
MREGWSKHRILKLPRVYTLLRALTGQTMAEDTLDQEFYPELGTAPLRGLAIDCGPAAYRPRLRRVSGLTNARIARDAGYVNTTRMSLPASEPHTEMSSEVAEESRSSRGRPPALSPVPLRRQQPVARMLAKTDRDAHGRIPDGYRGLAVRVIPTEQIEVRQQFGHLYFPFDHSVHTASAQ